MPIRQMIRTAQPENAPRPEIKKAPMGAEVYVAPEKFRPEPVEKIIREKTEPANMPSVTVVSRRAPVRRLVGDEARFKKIESILEEDLADIYFSLSPQVQQEFKTKGEETAGKITILLSKPKVKVKKIINLIRDWLKIIPAINRFFLEQEAKIKADKIIEESIRIK